MGILLLPSKGTKLVAPALDCAQHFTTVLILWVYKGIQWEGDREGRIEEDGQLSPVLSLPQPGPQSQPSLFSAKLLEGMSSTHNVHSPIS